VLEDLGASVRPTEKMFEQLTGRSGRHVLGGHFQPSPHLDAQGGRAERDGKLLPGRPVRDSAGVSAAIRTPKPTPPPSNSPAHAGLANLGGAAGRPSLGSLPMGVKEPALIAAYMFDGQDNEVVKHDVEREQT
jgi:hypothetical protein